MWCSQYIKSKTLSQFLIIIYFISFCTMSKAQEWEQIDPQNTPEARFGHSLVTLPDGNVVMFGGEAEDHRLFNDLHFFDGDDWTSTGITNDPPPARTGHSMWATDDGKVWIYGGRGSTPADVYYDLWSYDGEIWTKHEPPGENPGQRGLASSFTWGDKLGIAGGLSPSGFLSDVWLFDPYVNAWSKWGYIPSSVASASAFEHNGELFFLDIFPWILVGNLTDKTWREIHPTGDKPSERISAASCKSSDKAFLLGGSGSVLNDMWSFDFEEETWTQLIDLPLPLWDGSAAVIENKILLFGGVDDDDHINGNAWLYQFEDPTNIISSKINLPIRFSLYQNYPNPFNPSTTIEYDVPIQTMINLIVYDILGQKVKTLVNEIKEAGNYRPIWDGTNDFGNRLSSGIYIIRLETDNILSSMKVMMLK